MDNQNPSKEDLKIHNMHLLQVNQEGDSKMSSSRKTSNRTKKNAEKELFKNLYIDLKLDRTPQNINKNRDFDNLNNIISQKNSISDKNKGSLYLKQQQQQRRSISITGSGSGTHFSQRKTLEPQKSGFNFSQYAQYIDDELITQIQETKANQHKNFIQQFQKQKGEMPRISVDFIDLNNAKKSFTVDEEKFQEILEKKRKILENQQKSQLNQISLIKAVRKRKNTYTFQNYYQNSENGEDLNIRYNKLKIEDLKLTLPLNQYVLKQEVSLKDETDRNYVVSILRQQKKGVLFINFIKRCLESTNFFGKEENSKMLQKVPPLILSQCIKFLEFKKREIIFNQGEIGKSYYILLQGEVYTFIKKPHDVIEKQNQEYAEKHQNLEKIKYENIEQEKNKEKKNQKIKKRLAETKIFLRIQKCLVNKGKKQLLFQSLFRKTALEKMSENEYIQQFKQNYNMVKLYQPGEAFGELALLTKAKRAATMECKTDICLIQMSKQGFDLIVGSYLKFMNNQRIQFLRQFCFFNKVHYNQLSRCIHMLEEVKFIKNNVIFKENEEAQYLYLIKSGQIEISKQIDIEEQNTNINNQQQVQTQAKENISKMLKKVKKVKQIGLFILGINQDFGALEIVENRLTQVQATCCSESATIFRIKKDQFMQFMKQQDKENLEILKQACKQSQEQIEKRIEQVISGYAKISQFFTKSLYKDDAQKKFMIYQSITDQQRIDSPNYQNRLFTPKINKQSNFNSSRHISENQENLVYQQNQYILKKGYNNQKKLKSTSSFNITELKGQKKTQDFQSFNYPESDKIRKNLSYIKSSAEQSYSPSRKVKTDVKDYCDNDEFVSIYQNLDQKKFRKNINQKQIQQHELNYMDTSIQLQKGKSKFKSYQQQQQQMEEQEQNKLDKFGSQNEIYQFSDKTNQLSQRFISSKKEKNYKNLDLEKESKIQKFSKKTYQNGIQEQTNTKQDILNYLNKKKENLSLIYEHEALNDLHFQRLLLLQLKNYDIKMNKKEIDQTLEQFNQNQKQEFNQIQLEKNSNLSQDKKSTLNYQLDQQVLARQEYFNSRLPVKIQENKSNQVLQSSNSIKSSRNLKKITHKKDMERTSIYLENEANKDYNNDKKNFDLNQSYKSQDKSGSVYKSEYSSLNFPQQDKVLVKNSTSNFYLLQKQKIIDDRDKYIHNMVNPQDNLYSKNQQEIPKNIENKSDQYFPTLYDKKQSQSLDHLQLVKRMISKRSTSKKQQLEKK